MENSEVNEEDCICSFCNTTAGKVEKIFLGREGTLAICYRCVRACQAVLTDQDIPSSSFGHITGGLHKARKEKMRPITRIPKSWSIWTSDLYCSTPTVTARSPDGMRRERFSIPKQIAQWVIANDTRLDVDNIREEIKKDLFRTISGVIYEY